MTETRQFRFGYLVALFGAPMVGWLAGLLVQPAGLCIAGVEQSTSLRRASSGPCTNFLGLNLGGLVGTADSAVAGFLVTFALWAVVGLAVGFNLMNEDGSGW